MIREDEPNLLIGAKREAKSRARLVRVRRFRAAAVFLIAVMIAAVGLNMSVERDRQRQATLAAQAAAMFEATNSPVFAKIAGTDVPLHLPNQLESIVGIGFHQAYNQRSVPLDSTEPLREKATTAAITRSSIPGDPVSFVMTSRGRGSALTSSVDIAVSEGTQVKSPVSGRITKVVPYLLYGKYEDVRIEIEPDGHPGISVAIVHLDGPMVEVGQRVKGGQTALANKPRRLVISSQIDQYLGRPMEHIHLQVNPVESMTAGKDAS